MGSHGHLRAAKQTELGFYFCKIQALIMALKAAMLFSGLRSNVKTFGARTIVSLSLKENIEKPAPYDKPYDYINKPYGRFQTMKDKTTLRFDENSKLVVVEGAHAIGKTKLAKELAEEFGMLYMAPPDLNDIYIHPRYNIDFRQWQELYPNFFKIMDEKDFIRNPLGIAHGAADRMLWRQTYLRFRNHIMAIRHILNTGQGVVMEQCANSDHIYFNAAYNAGWVQPETKTVYDEVRRHILNEVLRPSLIVYLDAPVDVVQKNIKARGNEWDKDSPVWNNSQYLSNIYTDFKKHYLREIQQYSRVLVYDGAEPVDTEVVIEDIEYTELDNIELYDDQQRDWRFHNEEGAAAQRYKFTNMAQIRRKLLAMKIFNASTCDTLVSTHEEDEHMCDLMRHVKELNYAPGWNTRYGDKRSFLDYILPRDDYHIWSSFQFNQFCEPGEQLTWYEYNNAPELKNFKNQG